MHSKEYTSYISMYDLNPKVLSVSCFHDGTNYPIGYHLEPRYIYDYEIEYILYSKGYLICDDKRYDLEPGDIIFRKPYQYVQGVMPYTCYLVCVDMTGNMNRDISDYNFTEEKPFQKLVDNPKIERIPTVIKSMNSEQYKNYFKSLYESSFVLNEESSLTQKIYLLQIILSICNDLMYGFESDSNRRHIKLVRDTIRYISDNYASPIKLQDLADRVELSSSYFHKLFKATTNVTPSDYLMKVRLDRAKYLLTSTHKNISDISEKCGFNSPSYFNYAFKKVYQISPNQYREKNSLSGLD